MGELVGRDAEDLGGARVLEAHLAVLVEPEDALRQVGQNLFDLARVARDLVAGLGQLLLGRHLLGDVDEGDDEAAVLQPAVAAAQVPVGRLQPPASCRAGLGVEHHVGLAHRQRLCIPAAEIAARRQHPHAVECRAAVGKLPDAEAEDFGGAGVLKAHIALGIEPEDALRQVGQHLFDLAVMALDLGDVVLLAPRLLLIALDGCRLVSRGAAIAEEVAALVEARPSGDHRMARLAGCAGAHIVKGIEAAVMLQVLQMLVPVGIVGVGRLEVEAGGADHLRRAGAGQSLDIVGDIGEGVVGIGFPEPAFGLVREVLRAFQEMIALGLDLGGVARLDFACALARCDIGALVAADTAIAAEAPGLVEHRPARQNMVAHSPADVVALEAEALERAVGFEIGRMRFPFRRVVPLDGLQPVAGQNLVDRDAADVLNIVGDMHEAVLAIGLPHPEGRLGRKDLQARVRPAQRPPAGGKLTFQFGNALRCVCAEHKPPEPRNSPALTPVLARLPDAPNDLARPAPTPDGVHMMRDKA